MSFGNSGTITVGNVLVATSENGGHTPQFWADLATNKILHVADSTPGPLKDQAHAFRYAMNKAILHAIEQAILSDRSSRMTP